MSVLACQYDRQHPLGLPLVPRRFAPVGERVVVVIHLPENRLVSSLTIARPLLRPFACREPIDRAEIVFSVGIIIAVELREGDNRRQRGKAIRIGGIGSRSSRSRSRRGRGCCGQRRSGDVWRRGVRVAHDWSSFWHGLQGHSLRPCRSGEERDGEGERESTAGAGEPPSAAGAQCRVLRLADYTGGLLSFGNERAAPLVFPSAGAAHQRARVGCRGLPRPGRGNWSIFCFRSRGT